MQPTHVTKNTNISDYKQMKIAVKKTFKITNIMRISEPKHF